MIEPLMERSPCFLVIKKFYLSLVMTYVLSIYNFGYQYACPSRGEIAEKSNFLHLLQSWATSTFSFPFYSKYFFKLKKCPAQKFPVNTNLNIDQ